MTYLLKFLIGMMILFSSIALCHYIPAKIMGLNPKFEMKGWTFTVKTYNLTTNEALITGLMPIPFVAMWIFRSLFFIVDYINVTNNKLLCLVLMIILSVASSIMISISDLKVLYGIIH